MRMPCLLLLLTSCSQGQTIAPGKIVSNNPCIDAILAEVADPAQIGAVSAWSHDPDSASAPLTWARRYPAVGANAEELIAARPSLVLTGNLAVAGTNSALSQAGVKTVAVGVPATLADAAAQVMQIANAIGRHDAGTSLVARMEAAATPIQHHKSAIIWQASGFVPGKGTIQDEMLSRAGFVNSSARYGLKQWDVLPLETLLRDPPDIIFMPVSAGGDEGRAIAARRQVLGHLGTRAKVVAFPEKLLFCAGPGVIATMGVLKSASPSFNRAGLEVGQGHAVSQGATHPPQTRAWNGGASE